VQDLDSSVAATLFVTASPANAAKPVALSPAQYKAIALLQKGFGYHVRGAWRFRGSRRPIQESILLSLLEKGLAERSGVVGQAQFRITAAGCSIKVTAPI
jgi:hypothetical protein